MANQRERIIGIEKQFKESGISLDFFHVDTAHNPADAGTRGLTAQEIDNHDWIRGPRWLQDSPNTWPIKSIDTMREIVSEEYGQNTTHIVSTVRIKTMHPP